MHHLSEQPSLGTWAPSGTASNYSWLHFPSQAWPFMAAGDRELLASCKPLPIYVPRAVRVQPLQERAEPSSLSSMTPPPPSSGGRQSASQQLTYFVRTKCSSDLSKSGLSLAVLEDLGTWSWSLIYLFYEQWGSRLLTGLAGHGEGPLWNSPWWLSVCIIKCPQ